MIGIVFFVIFVGAVTREKKVTYGGKNTESRKMTEGRETKIKRDEPTVLPRPERRRRLTRA
jgi:hypothetical protein